MITDLFKQKIYAVNLGTDLFKQDLIEAGVQVVHVDWKPPSGGNRVIMELLDALRPVEEKINTANQKAFQILSAAQPILSDIRTGLDYIPGMTKKTILHAGPPVKWDDMAGPMRGAVIGALLYEGLATKAEEAAELAGSGEITFAPCHERGGVGPMAGIVSASMPVFVLENKVHGNRAFCTLNEGLGKVLRYGANSPEVVDRLRWIEKVLAPAIASAVRLAGGVDIKVLLSQAVQMGDEGHNRNKAATSLLLRALAPFLVRSCAKSSQLEAIFDFLSANDHFFLNLSMPYCKAVLDAASGIPYSTMVTAMARNGREFGIRISGLGEQWFTGPAQIVRGLMFPGFNQDDASLDIGDSAITETAGLGGFAMAAAPAIAQFVGGSTEDAVNYTERMYEITIGESRNFTIPQFNFRGTPTGIDLRKVLENGILPIINTGMAHKEAGVGQVGAGLVHPPESCFMKAIAYFARSYTQ